MYARQIKIENYKGILHADIDFDKKLNVFIGTNGAGKTSVLEAIVHCFSQIVSPYVHENHRQYFFKNSDVVHHSKTLCTLDLFVDFSELNDWKLHLFKYIGSPEVSTQEKAIQIEQEFRQFHLDLSNKYKLIYKTTTLPILKFYKAGGRNEVTSYSDDSIIYRTSVFETWSNLTENTYTYAKFAKWFQQQETKELQMQRDALDFEVKNEEIIAVRYAISRAMEILKGKKYKIKSDQIKKSGTNDLIPVLSLEEDKTKIKEHLDQKSDGEKAIIALIADIAYNLSIATHDKENALNGSGIVLIDEIEAHLHPNWQREIIPLLQELFPNIQFFITTHSPQVISSVNSENIILCEDFVFSKIQFKSKGTDSNTLLKYVFNATERPRKYIELIEEFEASIDANEPFEALEAIISKISTLESGDKGIDVSQLSSELQLRLEAHKFDLEHEMD